MSKGPVAPDVDDLEVERFAGRVKAARRAAKLSRADISRRTGISPSMLAAIEGRSTNPSVLTILRLAKGIGVPPHHFFTDDPVA